jgi:hypothetical protein
MRRIKKYISILVFMLFCSVCLSSCKAIEAQNITTDNNLSLNGGQVPNDDQAGREEQRPNNGPGMNGFGNNH